MPIPTEKLIDRFVSCDDSDRYDAKTACCMFLHAMNSTEIARINNNHNIILLL